MYKLKDIALFSILLTVLVSCGGRKQQSIEIMRPVDSKLSCDHLSAEQKVNKGKAVDLLDESNNDTTNNLGILIFVSPLFINLTDVQKKEIEALAKRNEHLEQLKTEKNCTKQ